MLVRTGWNFVPDAFLPRLAEGTRDLGWVARRHIPDLLHAADVLVQPGVRRGIRRLPLPVEAARVPRLGLPVMLASSERRSLLVREVPRRSCWIGATRRRSPKPSADSHATESFDTGWARTGRRSRNAS